MEWLQQLLDNSSIPIVSALLLGLLTALSPCPLATNITAIGFISKDIENRHRIFRNGMLYTLGRIITYAAIGFLIIPILRQGASIYAIEKAISKYGEMIIAPTLIIIGLFMLFKHRMKLPNIKGFGNFVKLKKNGGMGALLLGILFSLAFCPSSGIFYFGVLIPMAAAETEGFMLPVIFAIATSLPVIIISWVLAYSISNIGKIYHKMQILQKWINTIIAILFIAVGIYYATTLWF